MKSKNAMLWTPQMRKAFLAKRLALGLTYCALGRFLGVSWATIRKWELGQTKYCHERHKPLIRDFLRGIYDENFHSAMDADNLCAYRREIPLKAVECLQRLQNSHRILRTRPDLQTKLLDGAFQAVRTTLEKLLDMPIGEFD